MSEKLGQQFVDKLVERRPDLRGGAPDPIRIVAVGHSLGGGLAHHLAYSHLRAANAAGLWIERIFEHGEILAYARLLTSYVNPPPAAHPSVREIRFNFVQSVNPFSSHSMRLLACALIDASGQASIPDLTERFRGK